VRIILPIPVRKAPFFCRFRHAAIFNHWLNLTDKSNAMQIKAGTKFKSVEEYLSVFPEVTKSILQEMRNTIKKAAPQAEEVISYNMPAYKLNGILVYFAGYANHIGFYPTASGMAAFKREFSVYKNSKGAVQFAIDKPLPLALITKVVKFRISQTQQKQKNKTK